VEVVSLIGDDDEDENEDEGLGEALLSNGRDGLAGKKEGVCTNVAPGDRLTSGGGDSVLCCEACTYRHDSAESRLFLVCALCVTHK